MNSIKTVLFLTILMGLFIFVGKLIGGQVGMVVAFILAVMMNIFSYFFSDKIALKMYNAYPADENEFRWLYDIVRKLAQRANLPMPKIYIIPQAAPNAFATGRNPEHAVVAVTQGALELLTKEELAGVLGHELGHIKHRDILISTVVAIIAGAIMILADMARWAAIFGGLSRDGEGDDHPLVLLLMALVAPLAATLIQLAISRAREFEADKAGAIYSGNPLYLATALEKLEAYAQRIPFKGNPVTENLFIVNPFSAGGALLKLFSTHPPTQERIKRLREMARNGI